MIDGAKDEKEQLKALSELLGVKPNSASTSFFDGMFQFLRNEVALPRWVDGWFVCTNPYLDYSELVVNAFRKNFSDRGWCLKESAGGWLQRYKKHSRFTERTELFYRKLGQEQTGNYWVLPMVISNVARYSTSSKTTDSKSEGLTEAEFGLGPIEAICALLTHFDKRIFPGCISMINFTGVITEDLSGKSGVSSFIFNGNTPSFLGTNLIKNEMQNAAPIIGYYNW